MCGLLLSPLLTEDLELMTLVVLICLLSSANLQSMLLAVAVGRFRVLFFLVCFVLAFLFLTSHFVFSRLRSCLLLGLSPRLS